jgi:hypothetical protein
MPEKCKSCDADIVWATTVDGKAVPIDSPAAGFVDPEGDLRGLFAIVMGKSRVVYPLAKLPAELVNRAVAWRTHFATCPNAQQHRMTG